jgi:dephospho-CoA kinase
MRKDIKTVLMERDNMTHEEAEDLITEAMDDFAERLLHKDISSASDICMDYFGLEPDYLEDMIEGMI